VSLTSAAQPSSTPASIISHFALGKTISRKAAKMSCQARVSERIRYSKAIMKGEDTISRAANVPPLGSLDWASRATPMVAAD
jgi:hypothetical protein